MQYCYLHEVTHTLVQMTLHDQKCHFTPHFDHLVISNVIVILTMPSASCDADAGVSGVTWLKSYFALHFYHLDLRSAMVPLPMLFTSYDADASGNGIIWPKSHAALHFYHLDLKI